MAEKKQFYRITMDSGGKYEVWLVVPKEPDRLKHVFTHRDAAVHWILDHNGVEID